LISEDGTAPFAGSTHRSDPTKYVLKAANESGLTVLLVLDLELLPVHLCALADGVALGLGCCGRNIGLPEAEPHAGHAKADAAVVDLGLSDGAVVARAAVVEGPVGLVGVVLGLHENPRSV